MRRHAIIGRLGVEDRIKIPAAKDELVTELNFIPTGTRLNFGIGQGLVDLKKLGIFPSELGLDLLVMAAHVHAADTRISRTTESQDTWTRELRLIVPVSDVVRWTAAEPILKRLLNFLTGDRWSFGFRSRPQKFIKLISAKPAAPVVVPFDGVSLFSGGLDSLIGAIDNLEGGGKPLLISHAGEGAVSNSQVDCFNAVKKSYGQSPFNRLRVWMNFDRKLVKGVASEDTTRGRSFLFFALGVFAGTGLGNSFTLKVPENGLIALNVPIDPLRLGSLSTRTTHPFYMARWNDLLTALGVPGRVENPYWNKTKGEMVAACANKKVLARISPSSLSCSSPTKGRWLGQSTGHCGYCLPCLIRRAALGPQDSTTYSIPDLRAQELSTREASGKQVRSFQLAIERLHRRPGLAKLLIHKPGPLTDEKNHLVELAGVYRRGLEEVGRLLAGVRTGPG